MKFTTNYSPVTTAFISMTKEELKDFYEGFLISLPYCIEELMQLVKSTPGFENWDADYSSVSLDILDGWFATKAKKRNLTQEEIDIVKKGINKPIEIPSWTLTDETESLAVYIGMYYGQVAVSNNSTLKWEQELGSKKLADFGQPVVNGLGVVPLNPVRVAHSIACGFVDGIRTEGQLRRSYDYWSKLKMRT